MDILVLGLLAIIVALSLRALVPHPIRWEDEEAVSAGKPEPQR